MDSRPELPDIYAELVRMGPHDDVPDMAQLLTELLGRPAWHAQAACRGMGPDLFFVRRGEPTEPAKAICATCPVIGPCGEAGEMEVGIWGGASARTRRRERRPAA